ncbi:hypothetical protein Ddye_031793 [Dipteronia dyeriana]|uniref:Disease resistance protein At4g27190-like leucine-rich repeats domain-containing protein n=1 Tax=Dipteronia dyeriana TaxID=168575 RepID=A0AAD9TJ85_9ROSI|nr:hypothetical protein Ddye_031793 [Dipteronia dyeriana]
MSPMVPFPPGISSRMLLVEGFVKGLSKVLKLQRVEYSRGTLSLDIVCVSKALDFFNFYFDYFMMREEEEELQQQELPCRVQYMALEDFKCPVKLEEALQSLSSLRGLSISVSPEIISFPETSLPSQLSFMVIRKCNALHSLPRAWMHSINTSLKNLSIGYCDSLTSIARVQLPPNLKRLEIKYCSSLLTVLDEEEVSGSCKNTSRLEHLKIRYCPSLTSLWSKSNELPDTLREIKISTCSNLATMASSGNLPKSLRYLSIKGCSKMESIAKSFHYNTKLEKLYLQDCEKLGTLPNCIDNLISLTKLGIWNCPAMVSIPEGGFPTSLAFLVIGDTKICKSLFKWGLHRLKSLEALGIGLCLDLMSFPQEETGMILPTSLTTLDIVDFPNLERLSSNFKNLTCLKKLHLSNCPNLKYFPDDGLPRSLKQLDMEDCPLLEERCTEGEGLYWPIIAHLPNDVSDYITSEEDD